MIDTLVLATAKQWGLPATLLAAVVQAEGDIVKAVQCSLPAVTTEAQALDVLARSCVHAMADYIHAQDRDGFVAFWAARWAPVNAANDPQHLNQNWAGNVEKLWG